MYQPTPKIVSSIIDIIAYGLVAEARLELAWISAYEADEIPISPFCIIFIIFPNHEYELRHTFKTRLFDS